MRLSSICFVAFTPFHHTVGTDVGAAVVGMLVGAAVVGVLVGLVVNLRPRVPMTSSQCTNVEIQDSGVQERKSLEELESSEEGTEEESSEEVSEDDELEDDFEMLVLCEEKQSVFPRALARRYFSSLEAAASPTMVATIDRTWQKAGVNTELLCAWIVRCCYGGEGPVTHALP